MRVVTWDRGALLLRDSAVVLGELTLDVEVWAELAPRGTSTPGQVILQEVARGRTFRGSFDPSTDTRLTSTTGAEAPGSRVGPRTVQSVHFCFGNEFSWWTEKEVELIMLSLGPSGPPPALVPPLLPLRPLEAVPRGGGRPLGGGSGGDQQPPGLAMPPQGAAEKQDDREAALRFAAHLDEWLSAAEARRPMELAAGTVAGPWLADMLEKVALLRGLCKEAGTKAGATAPALAVEVLQELHTPPTEYQDDCEKLQAT